MSSHLPKDWKEVRVSDLAKIKTGNNKLTKASYVTHGYPAFSGSGRDGYCSHYEYDSDAIVIASVGARCGKGYLAKGKWTAIANTTLVFPDLSQVNLDYLYCCIRDENTWQKSGGAQPFVSVLEIESKVLSLPPLKEQQKIAEILISVDEVIENTQSQINKLEELKKATMNELLTKGIGHTEFKETEIGRIPKNWTVRTLSDLVDSQRPITYGIVQAGQHVNDGVPYIRVSDMKRRHISLKGMMRTSPEIAKQFSRSRVHPGDIVYALRGDIGKVMIVPIELGGANLTQGTALISHSNKIDTSFLKVAFESPSIQKQTQDFAKGSTFAEITLGDLKKLRFAIPQRSEQETISKILSALLERVEFLEERREVFLILKVSLMQDLLTGKVRVTVN
jgi:type I restriction enzyme S subunit